VSVLVTGGSGFVGLNLIEQLLARGEEVVSFSLASAPERAVRTFESLPGALRWVQGDVRDAPAVADALATSGARQIVHGAVITADSARERRDAAGIVSANVQGTVNVLEAARDRNVERFVYLSSASVYGANALAADVLSEEHTPPLPETLYAITKYAAEGIARRYAAVFGMPVVAARLSAVFGRWEYDTGLRDTLSPPYRLTRMAERGESVALCGDGDRDWIYAPEVAAGVIALMDAADLRYDVYNVGTGKTWNLLEWCMKLTAVWPAFSWRLASEGDGETLLDPGNRSPLCIERILQDTDFAPSFGLDQAFEDYLAWLSAGTRA